MAESSHRVQIIVAIIGLIGVLGAAAIASWGPRFGSSNGSSTASTIIIIRVEWGHPTDANRQMEVTGDIAARCDGHQSCVWQKNYNDFGDPWADSQKTLAITYRCGDGPQRTSKQLEMQVVGATSTFQLRCP